ncbi:MAG: toxin-antitoxin system antitoxin subunit [Euzebya sp.]
MTTPVMLPDDLVEAVRRAVGDGVVPKFTAKAVEAALRSRDFDDLLSELADEVGPIPPELAVEADAAWRAS